LIVCIPVPIISLVLTYISIQEEKGWECETRLLEKSKECLEELLSEIRTVREFAMEGEEVEKFAAASSWRAQLAIHYSGVSCILGELCFTCCMVARIYSMYIAGQACLAKEITMGQVMHISFASREIMYHVKEVLTNLPAFRKSIRPMGRVSAVLSSRPKIEPHPSKITGMKPEHFKGKIEFKNVHFTYPTEPNKKILNGLSFTARPGEKIGLVGSTGCGKSTTIKLIERFYNVTAGKILLDDRQIQDYDVQHLRRHMSVVAQDNILFSASIRENVLYGLSRDVRGKIGDMEIEEACRKANAWEFILKFPRKLETYIGERGVKLSGGQKQRLAIARAIIRKPCILLLDEATSALDAKAEKRVQDALDRMIEENKSGCTIIIAHRLTTIKDCDKIIVIEEGKNVEEGCHANLLNIPVKKSLKGEIESGWYRDLWNAQIGKDGEKSGLKSSRVLQLEEEIRNLEWQLGRTWRTQRRASSRCSNPNNLKGLEKMDMKRVKSAPAKRCQKEAFNSSTLCNVELLCH